MKTNSSYLASSHHPARGALVLMLVISLLAAAPTTKPLTADQEASQIKQTFNTFLQQGTNALAAGEIQAATESLFDARQVYDKAARAKIVSANSPEQIAMLHGLAIAYQLNQKPDKASPLFENNSILDVACKQKNASRQLLVTRGFLDATQGYLAMRTVVRLTQYLKDHPDELDSELLDVLFTALVKADEKVTNRELMLDPAIKLYEQFNERLEKTKPELRRWGVKWVKPIEYATMKSTRDRAVATYDSAQDAYDSAIDHTKAAERNHAYLRTNGSSAAIANASAQVARAKEAQAAASKAVVDAKAKIPAIPVLSKEDFKRILLPTPSAVAAADAKPAFSLGGREIEKPKSTITQPDTKPAVATTFQPPAAQEISKRKFSRSATGFAVGPDLILSTAAIKDAKRIIIEFPEAQPIEATIEKSGEEGLVLLRIKGATMPHLNLAASFAGGDVNCPAHPEVSIFGVHVEMLKGRTPANPKENMLVALNRHPRLPGAPLLDPAGALVGIELAERDTLTDRIPALGLAKIAAFLGDQKPSRLCADSNAAPIVQITATFEK